MASGWWHGRVGTGATQFSYGPVEGCVSSQDRIAEEHTKASKWAMAVMDLLSQNRPSYSFPNQR
jgi:hypothetical protein